MKIQLAVMMVLGALISANAFAESVCWTLNQPNKWQSGLVLRIYDGPQGEKVASLESVGMFRGVARKALGGTTGWGVVYPVTKSVNESGQTVYEGRTEGKEDHIKVVVGNDVSSVELQVGSLELHTQSATFTLFDTGVTCESYFAP